MLPQIYGNIVTIRPQALTQILVLLLADLLLAKTGHRVEKLEFDEFVDAVLDFREGPRSTACEHMDRGTWEYLLQPPNGRNGGDEITNVINLYHKYSLDFVVAEHRMTGVDHLGWLVIGPIVIRMTGEPRAEIWIAGGEYYLPPLLELREIEHFLQPVTARRFIMQQGRIRRIYNQLP